MCSNSVQAMDYGKYGITVNAYAPGAVETSLLAGVDAWQSQKMGQPPGTWAKSLNDANVLGRNGQPNDVVGVVSFLVSKDASFITGQTITVDGGSVYD
ncbi:Diacetyl reductase [(S)-acetoin forming] [Grifola frondosa]|uniref:Diacetyl reductase [(S)-acetoin forming] n=1 Tax=Grifola frondosa TaxID=5627 RepID=A0A1C7M3N9_GRIFR|nr:Diacetyl reductase [(S)-acetoin forming] [Grifola frondosa]